MQMKSESTLKPSKSGAEKTKLHILELPAGTDGLHILNSTTHKRATTETDKVVIYGRVSGRAQKQDIDLDRQLET